MFWLATHAAEITLYVLAIAVLVTVIVNDMKETR